MSNIYCKNPDTECPLSAPIKYLMGHKISVPAFMSPVTIGQCGDTATGAWEHWPLGTPGHHTRAEAIT